MFGDDGGVEDRGMSSECGFDFAELDAKASKLDLEVRATEVEEAAVVCEADEVACFVEALGGECAWDEEVEEALLGEVGSIPVAASELWACDVELTWDADGDGVEVSVENEEAVIGERLAEGDRLQSEQRLSGDPNGGFCGAVEVEKGAAVRRECSEQVWGKRFSA